MHEVVVSVDSKAEPSKVWEVMTDLDRSPDTIRGIVAVERLDGDAGFEVGTRWRETRAIFGREATEEMEVVSINPGRSYTVLAASRGNNYTTVMTVEPAPTGSRVAMSFQAEPTGTVSKLLAATMGRLMIGATKKMIARDVEDIAAAAEVS